MLGGTGLAPTGKPTVPGQFDDAVTTYDEFGRPKLAGVGRNGGGGSGGGGGGGDSGNGKDNGSSGRDRDGRGDSRERRVVNIGAAALALFIDVFVCFVCMCSFISLVWYKVCCFTCWRLNERGDLGGQGRRTEVRTPFDVLFCSGQALRVGLVGAGLKWTIFPLRKTQLLLDGGRRGNAWCMKYFTRRCQLCICLCPFQVGRGFLHQGWNYGHTKHNSRSVGRNGVGEPWWLDPVGGQALGV